MRAWLLTVGEPLPTDRTSDRAWRTSLLARQLVARGHDVVWWSSAFDHARHRRRSPVDVAIPAGERLAVWHLDGAAYTRNVSVVRLLNHYQVATRFRRSAPLEPKPDVILASLPTLELCCAAVDYGRTHAVPVAVDVRDLWPDVLADFAPRGLRTLARHALPWMTMQRRKAMRGASAILGVTDEFVEWGLGSSGRAASQWDRAFAMGYAAQVPDEQERAAAARFWDTQGIGTGGPSVVCFFGALGWMFDFDTVLAAAARLSQVAPTVRLVVCGAGENLGGLRRRAEGLDNVLLPGHVGQPEIWELMQRSIAGLAPYRPFRNFDDNLANKPIEYLSAGLPVISSNVRVLKSLLDTHGCGLTYAHGNAEALAAAIARLHGDRQLRAEQSARAARLYRERFVAERVYGEMAEHLERLAERGR